MRPAVAIAALLSAPLLAAQGTERTVHTDTGTVVLHWFTTGELSTKAWTDAADRWGRSRAYDKGGRVIFDRQTRRFAGHASVDFRYHPNGGISRAEVSDMPDGGIQWYKSTTTFDEDGKQTGFNEYGWDNNGPMGPLASPAPKQQEVREQRMFINEYFVVARKNCRVQLRPKDPSPAARDMDATLLKGDTLRGGMYSMGEQWSPPLDHVQVTATNRRGKPKYKVLRVDMVQLSGEHRRYYLVVGK